MKIKVSEASGSQLDWAVAIATGIPAEELYISGKGKYQALFRWNRDEDGNLNGTYTTGPDLLFSTKWEAGGPIIEREKITVAHNFDANRWEADMLTDGGDFYNGFGSTSLIAAMRCYVASKLGDEVDIPKELK